MSTTVRNDFGAMKLIASSKQTIASATTTNFDFGTPDDINLATASTAGVTHTLAINVQDAPDNAGAIGTPATAVTTTVAGNPAAVIGDKYAGIAVTIQAGRPWLRVSATDVGTDSYVCHCTVWAVPSGL